MAQARGSLRQVAYVVESVFGTTPVTPSTQLLEFAEFKGAYSAAEVVDPSINAYRQTVSARKGNVNVGATLSVALCPDNYDAFLEALLMGTWTTNVLKVGTVATAVRRSFAVEEGFTDLAQYQVYNGMVINTAKITFPADNSLVMADFEFIGTDLSAASGTSVDATPTAVTTKQKFFHADGSIAIAGSTVGWITSMDINFNNDYDPKFTFGSTSAHDVPFGNAEITGKISGLFDSITEWERYKAGTSTSATVVLASGAETLTFLLPQIKYTNGSIVSSSDAGILVEFDFTAEYNDAEATSLKITRV